MTGNWRVIFPDGRCLTDEEVQWQEISVPRYYGQEVLQVLRQPAHEIGARMGGRWHTLKAPNVEDTHFFRYYRGRVPLSVTGGPAQLLYQAIGYICPAGRITLEIDPQGNTTLRFDPTPTEFTEAA